jgi:hypothetical protein
MYTNIFYCKVLKKQFAIFGMKICHLATLDKWAFVFFVQFAENYRSSPIVSDTFLHVFISATRGWATFWAIYSRTRLVALFVARATHKTKNNARVKWRKPIMYVHKDNMHANTKSFNRLQKSSDLLVTEEKSY